MHYLSEQVINAERLSASKVSARVKAGWAWRRLEPGFGACGGTASYSRALISPEGVIAFVSDRAKGMDLIDTLPALPISYDLLPLTVPYEEKEQAKALGATWVGHKKTWACDPDAANKFKRWISKDAQVFNLLAD
jgi:hypothetical protein